VAGGWTPSNMAMSANTAESDLTFTLASCR